MRSWWIVALVALVVRTGLAIALADNLAADPDAYRALASHLAEGHYGLSPHSPTAFRPPLYPLLLAPLTQTTHPQAALAALHLALGVLTVVLTMCLARRAGLGSAAALAGLLVAVDPLLVWHATLVMTETLAALLAVLAVLALDQVTRSSRWSGALFAGLVLGLAILCRPTFLVFFPLAALGLVGLGWVGLGRVAPSGTGPRWSQAAVFAAAVVATLAPWTLRNWYQLGAPIYSTTHGGYTLWLANNASYYNYLRQDQHDRPWSADELDPLQRRMFHAAGQDEVAADRAAFRAAFETIRRQPAMFAYSCLVRLGQFVSPLPQRLSPDEPLGRRAARYLVAVWYTVFFAALLVGLVARRADLMRSPWLWLLLMCGALALVHTFFWSNLRMRAPIMPLLALPAAAGLERVLRGAFGKLGKQVKMPADEGPTEESPQTSHNPP